MMRACMLCILLLLAFLTQVWCRGELNIRFLSYNNFDGKDENGACCDRGFGCIKNGCDHTFIVCLDNISRLMMNETKKRDCAYGHYETGETNNLDNVTFGTMIGKTKNPLNFTFNTPIPSEMALRVLVEDYDPGRSNDRVELLKHRLVIPDTAISGRPFRQLIQKRTRLDTEVYIECDPNYYGPDCGTYCRPPSPGQHYTCDTRTGYKICNQGYTGSRCTQEARKCPDEWCNGGACTLNSAGHRHCSCPENLSGERCESHACEQRCSGGYCEHWGPANNQYRCHCGRDYEVVNTGYGDRCEQKGRRW